MKNILTDPREWSGFEKPLADAQYRLLQTLLVEHGYSADRFSILAPLCQPGIHQETECRKAEVVEFYINSLLANVDLDNYFDINECGLSPVTDIQVLSADVQYLASFTALTGSGTTSLDSISTTDKSDGYIQAIVVSGVIYFYRLSTATTAEASPTIIRANDYATGNTRIWTLLHVALGGLKVDGTVTPALTVGAQTINLPAGTVNFAAGASSLVVTNNLVTAASLVFAVVRTADATLLYIKSVVCGAGSFTLTANAAATAETSVGFIVINVI